VVWLDGVAPGDRPVDLAKEEHTHARVTILRGSPGDVDSGIANFQANVLPFAQEHGKEAILLVDRHSGRQIHPAGNVGICRPAAALTPSYAS
jgi:hypothetical protein